MYHIPTLQWWNGLLNLPNTLFYKERELHLAFSYESMKGFRMHAKFLRCKCGLRIIFFCLHLEDFIKSSTLKISKLKGSSNDQKAVQIPNPSYATRSPARAAPLRESLLQSHSKHPSYKSILFKYIYIKSKAHFPQLKQLMLFLFFTKSAQGLRWRNAAFPTVNPTSATDSEVWLET